MSAAIVLQTRVFNCAPLEQVIGIDPMKGDGSGEPPPPKRQKQLSHFFRAKPQPTETDKQEAEGPWCCTDMRLRESCFEIEENRPFEHADSNDLSFSTPPGA